MYIYIHIYVYNYSYLYRIWSPMRHKEQTRPVLAKTPQDGKTYLVFELLWQHAPCTCQRMPVHMSIHFSAHVIIEVSLNLHLT